MIKRINISLTGLLCLVGQYEHILCTSAAPTTNDTICQTEDDLDYILCNLEDLSDAALLEICSSHRLVSSEWDSNWFKFKDGSDITHSHQSLVVDAETCIHVRDKIQLHLLTVDKKIQLHLPTFDGTFDKDSLSNIKQQFIHRQLVNTFAETTLYKKKDTPDYVIGLFHSYSKAFKYDPWVYISELWYQMKKNGMDLEVDLDSDIDTAEQFLYNRKVLKFIAITLFDYDEELKDGVAKIMSGEVSVNVGIAFLYPIALAVIVLIIYIRMLHNKARDSYTCVHKEQKKKSSKKKKGKKKKN